MGYSLLRPLRLRVFALNPTPLVSNFLFNFFALFTVITAVGVVVNKNAVNAEMCLLLCLAGVWLARGERAGVRVRDFGIRGMDLAYALESCDAAILVDVVRRGGAPGTLYVIEPAPGAYTEPSEPHAMTPDRVLASLPPEARPKHLRLVGCEPLTFEPDPDEMGLSAPVAAAIPPALAPLDDVLRELGGAGA